MALPVLEAERLLLGRPAAWGVGVYPDDRDGRAFWIEVSSGATRERQGVRSPLAGRRCLLAETLRAGGHEPRIIVGDAAPTAVADAVREAFCGAGASGDLSVVAVADARAALPFLGDGTTLVLGVTERTPVLVGLLGAGKGLLAGGIARRPGIVTPYDLTATVLDRAGVERPASGVVGRALRVRPADDPGGEAAALAERLERDARFGPAAAGAAIGVLLGGGIVLSLLLLLAGASGLARRSARGGAAAALGLVASLFVPSGHAGVRSIPVVAAYLIAFAWPDRGPDAVLRQIGRLLATAAAVVAVAAVAAALRPHAEPALSLWGDPLVSWRFFGLRNHQTSIVHLGVIAGAALALRRRSPWLAAAAGIAGAAAVGAPRVGANFVAVLTLLFGAGVAAGVLARGAVRVRDVALAGAVAVVGFGATLLADAGSPVSHGGQAVERVRVGGLAAAVDFVRIRARLNAAEIGSLWGGWVWTALLAAGLVAIFAWAWRDGRLERGVRAAMAGGAAAALASLVLEDTGFLSGGLIALAPGLVAMVALPVRLGPGPIAARLRPGRPHERPRVRAADTR